MANKLRQLDQKGVTSCKSAFTKLLSLIKKHTSVTEGFPSSHQHVSKLYPVAPLETKASNNHTEQTVLLYTELVFNATDISSILHIITLFQSLSIVGSYIHEAYLQHA